MDESLISLIQEPLDKILEIVGHPVSERAEYTQVLMNQILQLTITGLIATLPPEQRTPILADLASTSVPITNTWEKLNAQVKPELIFSALRMGTQEVLKDYLTKVGPHLPSDRRTQLIQYLKEISSI